MKIEYQNWSTAIFEGFYESGLFDSDSLYDFDNELPDGYEWDIDFEEFQNRIGEKACEMLTESLSEMDFKFKGISSPKYYNYSTDKICAEVETNVDLEKYAYETHESEFSKYLQDNFTSCDGFISFVPNNIAEFKENPNLNVLLEFYILNEMDLEQYRYDLREEAYDYLMCNRYIVNSKTGKEVDFEWCNDEQRYIVKE